MRNAPPSFRVRAGTTLAVLLLCWTHAWAENPSARRTTAPASIDPALRTPLQSAPAIVFCTRAKYDDPHWYANIGYYCDDETRKAYPGNGQPGAGQLIRLDLSDGAVRVLLDAHGGSVRDPIVHYDGNKILFSYRPADADYFHLHEINADGSGLKQLTFGEFDDYEPTYLPDGGIAFVSTRCNRWVNCWKTQVGVIYRCDGDGGNIRLISANTEHDNTPWMLPDGRLLYTRWEYVDRSQVEFHHLWTMNPDGTGQSVYFGNMRPHILMIDAKPIPGTATVLASFSPGHGVNEHAGVPTIVTPALGPDHPSATRAFPQRGLSRDPYPLSERLCLAARGKQIVLLDDLGRTEVLYTHTGEGDVHEPRPLTARPREPLLPERSNPGQANGTMILLDVYTGRNMEGVRRGDIKKLLVLESLPKQVNFSGGPDLVSWLGTFTLERVLGTVPVEPDGSAAFHVPAQRQLFFVALDENDLSVKRMQSFTSAMPGEIVSCVGCHEHRETAPYNRPAGLPAALRRPPSPITPFTGHPDVLDFARDIQPILDRHCVACHSYEKPGGHAILAGDLGPNWSHSYFSLLAHDQVADGKNGLGNKPPRTVGSSASALLKKVDGSHYQTTLSDAEWRTLWLWIESGAPFAGSYAALRNERQQTLAGQATHHVLAGSHRIIERRCRSCHANTQEDPNDPKPLPFRYDLRQKNRQLFDHPTAAHERLVLPRDPMARFAIDILLNFTRPELSPLLLGPLARESGGYGSCGDVFRNRDDPDYKELLTQLREGRRILNQSPRYGTPGFQPNPQYLREMKKYGILAASTDPTVSPIDVFAADQAYWKSFWYRPPVTGHP